MSQNLRRIISLIVIFLVLVISGAIVYNKDALLNFSQYGYLGTFVISFLGSATILLPVPSLLLTFAVGSVYKPLVIGSIAATGAALGEFTGYVAGLGGRVLLTSEQKFLKTTQDRIKKYGLIFITLLAAIPNPLFDLVGIAAGIMGIKPIKFFLAALIGQIIKFTFTAYLGSSVSHIF